MKEGEYYFPFFIYTKQLFSTLISMLVIYKNSTAPIIVTVREKQTLSNPYYLFVFTNDITKRTVSFFQSNISPHADRYDEFMITETSGTPDYSSGVVEFLPTGSWSYDIYEQDNNTNFNPELSTSKLETGMAKIIGTNETYSRYTGQDITYKVHERNQ